MRLKNKCERRLSARRSDVKEHRLILATQVYIKVPMAGVVKIGCAIKVFRRSSARAPE